jgi:hypothetical protein
LLHVQSALKDAPFVRRDGEIMLVQYCDDLKATPIARTPGALNNSLVLNSSHRFDRCKARCRIAYSDARTIFRFATAIFMRYQTRQSTRHHRVFRVFVIET